MRDRKKNEYVGRPFRANILKPQKCRKAENQTVTACNVTKGSVL